MAQRRVTMSPGPAAPWIAIMLGGLIAAAGMLARITQRRSKKKPAPPRQPYEPPWLMEVTEEKPDPRDGE